MPRPSKATSLGPYILLETIGHGSFGKVKRAIHRDSRRVFAIKIMEKESILQSKVDTQVRKETLIMTTLDHPNVVKMYQAMTTISKVVIVMELVTGGELYHEILRHKRLTEDSARHYYRQLINGLHHCHSHGVYHRDLKPENLLLDQNGCLKISDFGLSTLQLKHEDRCHTQCGTPNYVAPEVISRAIQGYDGAKVDVWSSGIVLYVLVAGELPFDDNDPTELFRKIVAGVFELPHWFSDSLRDLIPHLLDLEPESRYGLDQIRSHPWYTQETPPAPPPLPIPAALPVTSSTIAAAAAETSASCASVAVAAPMGRGEEDALFPGMNFINPTFKPTDTPGNVHPDVKLSIGQQSDLSAFGAPPVAPVDAGAHLPVAASRADGVLRSGAVPPLPPPTARRPRSRQSSYLSRFQSAEHLSDAGVNTTRPDTVPDAAHSDGDASMVEEEVTAYIAPDPLPPPPRLVTGVAAVRHAPTAVRAAAPSNVSSVGAPIGTPSRSVRQDNIDRVAAELMAANDSAPLNEVPSALNVERLRRYLIQQQTQVLQQHHSSTDTDRSPLGGAAPALSAEGIRQLAVAREAAAVAVAASVVAAPSPSTHAPTPFTPTKADAVESPYVPQVLPAAGSGVAELAFGVPPLPLAAVDPAVVAALDAQPAQDLDDVASSGANQFDDAPADSGDLVVSPAGVARDTPPQAPVHPPPSATPAPTPHVSTSSAAAAAAVEHVDPDRGAASPSVGVMAVISAPAVAPAAWTSPPLSSPLVDLTAAVSCNICVGCVQGEACEAPVDVNAEVYNRGLDSMWQKLVDACEAEPVEGGVAASPAAADDATRHLSLSIDQLHSSHAPDRPVSVPASPLPAGTYHGAHGHALHHNPDAVGERRGTYSSRRDRGSASGSTRSRRSNAAPGEVDKRRGSPRHDKSSAGSSRRRSRTSFDSKHALRESRDQASAAAHVHDADHVRSSHASGAHLAPTVSGRQSSDAGPHRSTSSVDEQRQPTASEAVPRSAASSASGRAASNVAHKHEGDALGRSESAASIESDANKHVDARAAGRVVRPSSAGSHSSSRARRLMSADSSVGHRGTSSPMTSGGNVESQLLITRNHQLLKHIGKPWRAVGPGRADKRSDESRVSPGPPKPLFPPALVDDGELVVIAGDEPCLTPASPDVLVSIGSAVGSDGHPSRHLHSRTGGSLSDEDGAHAAARTGSSRENRSGGGQRDGEQRSSRSLLRSESSREQRNRGSSSRGHSPASHSRYSRHRSSQEQSGPFHGAQRSLVLDDYRSSRSGRHERRPSGYRKHSPHEDSTSRGSARLESRRSSRRESPVRSSRRGSSGRSSRRGSPSRSSRRRSPGGSSRLDSARASGSSHRPSRLRSPDTSRRERSRSHSRSPRRSSRRGSPCRSSCCEASRHSTRAGVSKLSRHKSPALYLREHASSGRRGSRGSASRRRDGSYSSSSRRRELGSGGYRRPDGAPTHTRDAPASGGPLSSAPALALASSRRDEVPSETSSRSPRSQSEVAPHSPSARDDRADHAARDWVADCSPRGGPGAAVGGTPTPASAGVDEPVGRPTAVAGSLEGSTITSVTGSSSVGVVEVSRLGGLKGVTSRLLAKAPLQLGPGRGRRDTEFNSLLSPRATMEKLVLVLRGIPAVQAADAVEASADAYRVHVRSLVSAPGRGGTDLLRVTVTVFRREPGGLTVASFRRSKGRQDGDDFKAWYAVAYDSFCNWDDRSAEHRAGGRGIRAAGAA